MQIRTVQSHGCAWVTLDRPPLNLLTPSLIDELGREIHRLRSDPTIRALVITGAGRHMTGGMQLQELRDLTPDSARLFISALRDAIESVHSAPLPTIAMVNGACLGAGFELALACDLRVLSSEARFGLPEVRVGIPSVIHAALLPAYLGPGRAAELLLTGESMTAEQALQWGLANRVVPPGALREETERMVASILQSGPRAIRLQKELMVEWRDLRLSDAVDAGVGTFARAYRTDEPREAMQAFIEKRAPRFDN